MPKNQDQSSNSSAELIKNTPQPILASQGGNLVQLYNKSWVAAQSNRHSPPAGSPLVADWIGAAYNTNLFQWDTFFISMFSRYGSKAGFPAAPALDNFYALQKPSGYICRQYNVSNGDPVFYLTKADSVNPPLFAWAELEYFWFSRDTDRLRKVLPKLEDYAAWIDQDAAPSDSEPQGRRDKSTGLYWNTNLGSGMDNLGRSGTAWVDMSAQTAMMYASLGTICEILGISEKANAYKTCFNNIAALINEKCWDASDCFYYDRLADGSLSGLRTAAGFWPLLAGVADQTRADSVIQKHLAQGMTFWLDGLNAYPALDPGDGNFSDGGDYWNGGVWAPVNYMIIKGLEKFGYYKLAAAAAGDYLNMMAEVLTSTAVEVNTIWEYYAPVGNWPGSKTASYKGVSPGVDMNARTNFVGWSGIGPIALLIESYLGICVEPPDGKWDDVVLSWTPTLLEQHGCKNLSVGGANVSLLCEERVAPGNPMMITVTTDEAFTLVVKDADGNQPDQSFNMAGGQKNITVAF